MGLSEAWALTHQISRLARVPVPTTPSARVSHKIGHSVIASDVRGRTPRFRFCFNFLECASDFLEDGARSLAPKENAAEDGLVVALPMDDTGPAY